MDCRALVCCDPMASTITRCFLCHGNRTGIIHLRMNTTPGVSLSNACRKQMIHYPARASSSTSDALVGSCTPQMAPANRTPQFGSPLLWIAVGVGLSAWFSVMATKLKRHAIHQAFKSLMGEEAEGNGKFNTAAFSSGSPLPMEKTELPKPTAAPNEASDAEVEDILHSDKKTETELNVDATKD
ncbi:hypothetical protein HPP92_017745 [Vanilla planifolia]|uniref:Uncharacterized protein n=1 Tax=Vanilla planifolia TaxID=51239 RepID=A0A835UMP2_VANPL|nr:hypothetical protein HPP92_017745 [Vanilla planifolia]